MKIQKPEDEKYFKDITLNNILQEISNENEIYNNCNIYKEPEKKSNKKISFQIIFLGIFPILLLFFFFIPLKHLKFNEQTKPSNTFTLPQHVTNKTVINTSLSKKNSNKKTVSVKKDTLIENKINLKIHKLKVNNKTSTSEKEKERALAKEALRKQILR